jgi:hypothetical protein
MMNAHNHSSTTRPNAEYPPHQQQQQPPPSAPTYLDLLSDDSYFYSTPAAQPLPTVVTPTANAVYMSISPNAASFPSSSSSTHAVRPSNAEASSSNEDKVVMIPSDSVFIEQQNLRTTTMSNSSSIVNHTTAMTPSSSSFAPVFSYNHNTYHHHEDAIPPYESSSNRNDYYHPNDHDYTNNETAIATLHDPDHAQRYFNGKPVKPKHAHLPDSVLAFKAERKRRTVMATCTGGAVGLIALGPVLGPFGAVIGATSAYAAAKTVGKHRERKITEHAILQQNYLSSSIRDENAIPSSTDIVRHHDQQPQQLSSSTPSSGASQYYAATGNNGRSMSNIPIDQAEVA